MSVDIRLPLVFYDFSFRALLCSIFEGVFCVTYLAFVRRQLCHTATEAAIPALCSYVIKRDNKKREKLSFLSFSTPCYPLFERVFA